RASSAERSSSRRAGLISGPTAGEDLVEVEVLRRGEALVDGLELLDLLVLERHGGGQHALAVRGVTAREVIDLAAQRVGGARHGAGSPLPRPCDLLRGALGA